jgi:hypothetical protein
MKSIKNFLDFLNESMNDTEIERLSGFYQGDKYEVRIKNSDENSWYKNNINDTLVVVKDEKTNNWKVVPQKLFVLFNIKDVYSGYKSIRTSGTLYIKKEDCDIVRKL